MRSRVLCLSTSALVLIAICGAGCRTPSHGQWDAATQATPPDADAGLPPPGRTYEVIGPVPGLQKFVVKHDHRFYRGGDILSDQGAAAIKEHGVRTVISVTPTPEERKLAAKHGMKLVEITFESKRPIPKDTLAMYLDAVRSGQGPFYVHCHGGTHRAGALGLAYRVHIQGWDYDQALIEFGRLGGSLKDDHVMVESLRKSD